MLSSEMATPERSIFYFYFDNTKFSNVKFYCRKNFSHIFEKYYVISKQSMKKQNLSRVSNVVAVRDGRH